MADVQLRAYRTVSHWQKVVYSSYASPLHQEDHLRRSEYLNSATAQVLGGMLFGYDQIDLSPQAWLDSSKAVTWPGLPLGLSPLASWIRWN